MAHIVAVWELGGHLGHLGHIAALVPQLQAAGHRVTLVARDLSRCLHFPELRQVSLYQAPIWLPRSATAPNPPHTMAEILAHYGFLSSAGLHALVKAWRSLLEGLAPDLVLYEYAPAALLASRGLHFRKATIGTGFTAPPSTDPIPAFRDVRDEARAKTFARRVLHTANRVLALERQQPLDHLGELFATDETFLCTLPLLDHYPRPPGTRYWGLVNNSGNGQKAAWQNDDRPRVFAYIKPPDRRFDNTLKALAASGVQAAVFAPGVSSQRLEQYRDTGIRISRHPFDLDSALTGCQAVICHAGHNTFAAGLLAGRPVLAIPQQWEQGRLAEKAQSAGLGVKLSGDGAPHLAQDLERVLNDAGLRQRVRDFASEHAELTPAYSIPRIVRRCHELALAGAR